MSRRLAVAELPERTAPNMREAVETALAAMPWLTESDRAMCDLARSYADQIEQAHARADALADLFSQVGGDPDLFKRLQKLEADCNVVRVVGWLGQQLQGVLKDLGGAPAARKAMQVDQPMGSRLDAIRSGAAAATGKRPAAKRPARKGTATG